MKQRLEQIAGAAAERQRPLQALISVGAVAGGVWWVSGPGWALIVTGALLLADVVAEGLPRRRRAQQ